jgi:hypothetical protein
LKQQRLRTEYAVIVGQGTVWRFFAKLKALLHKAAQRSIDGLKSQIGALPDAFAQQNAATISAS